MKANAKAKEEFNQKIAELEKETQPALYASDLKEIVLYEKLLEMQEQISKLAEKMDKKSMNYSNGN